MMTWASLIPLAAFFAITLAVWAVLSVVADRPINSEERLRRGLNPNAARPHASALSRQQDKFQAKFAEAAQRLGHTLKPHRSEAVGNVRGTPLNSSLRSE